MSNLPELARWVAEAPAAVRSAEAHLPAVLADLFETLYGEPPASEWLAAFDPGPTPLRRYLYCLRAAHLLWHPDFRAPTGSAEALTRFFLVEVPKVAAIVEPASLDADEERREELIRLTLRAVGGTLEGESNAEAEDRLKQVDSVERRRLLLLAAKRERRAREVREAMAKKAAEEAAAKVSRE